MKYVTVTYPNKHDANFDFDYYMRKHIPMVSRLLGTSIEVIRNEAARRTDHRRYSRLQTYIQQDSEQRMAL